MTGNTRHISLMVVAGLAILFMAYAAPALAQSTTEKDDYLRNPSSTGPNEELATEEGEAEDDSAEEDALISKGRNKKTRQTETQQSNNTAASVGKKNLNQNLKKTTSSQNSSVFQNRFGESGKKVQTVPRATSMKPQDLSKISIGNKNSSSPISLANQGKLEARSIGKQPVSVLTGPSSSPASLANQAKPGATSVGKQPVSVLTGPPVSGLTGPSASALTGPGSLAKTGISAADILKTNLGGLGIKTAPAPGGNTTNTQGDVTGGGKGSVTTGGVQSGGGAGSNTQGSTVSTGGGNTVGGIQQSGSGNSVDINQTTNNITNVTKVSGGGGGGGGFSFGGGGGGGEIPSIDVSPIEPEPQPVVVTRVVAAPQDSCPTVVELNQMGFNYYQAGTFNSAEDVFKRALEILDKQLCKDKPLKATTLENLAFTSDKLDRHDEAIRYQEQAQLIRRMLR